jgi:hypothetical protein
MYNNKKSERFNSPMKKQSDSKTMMIAYDSGVSTKTNVQATKTQRDSTSQRIP